MADFKVYFVVEGGFEKQIDIEIYTVWVEVQADCNFELPERQVVEKLQLMNIFGSQYNFVVAGTEKEMQKCYNYYSL